jgi:hypothetical protein
MKVKEFIEQLKQEDQEREVIMSCDSEGNSYSPFSSIGEGFYLPDSTWSGDWVDDSDPEYVEEVTEENGKAFMRKHRAICLFPIN